MREDFLKVKKIIEVVGFVDVNVVKVLWEIDAAIRDRERAISAAFKGIFNMKMDGGDVLLNVDVNVVWKLLDGGGLFIFCVVVLLFGKLRREGSWARYFDAWSSMSEELKEIIGVIVFCKVVVVGGVEVCFVNFGILEMYVVGVLVECADIRSVFVFYENVVTGAVDGYFCVKCDVNCDWNVMVMIFLYFVFGLMNGFLNLYNVSRGRSFIFNVVGEMSTFYRGNEVLLENDIELFVWMVLMKYVYMSVVVDVIVSDVVDVIEVVFWYRGVVT